jgi:uncharacterized membrane protein
MGFLFFLFALVGWAYLYSRMRRVEDRLNENQYEHNRDVETIAELTRRVWALEKSQAAPAPPAPPPAGTVAPPPVILPLAQPTPAPEPIPEPLPTIAMPEVFREPAPPPPTWRDQLRASMGGQEWEAVVGGNWLNKLGVLVLVIGIALLLGYEFTHVGPLGRVATGMAVGLAMLISGVLVERKSAYAIFARGLIGGGWAALYFTTYAMHALPAARVIDNPYSASVLVLAVACGMILHSLRYQSQTVSGLAYFIAFATLALSESTPFSVLALLPLAASLLYLAYRFHWNQMAVFGLFATYATCASRPDVGAPLGSTQALFAMYWLLFESFDLLRMRRSTASWTIDSFILPLNALGFLGLSLIKWERSNPEHLYAFLAVGAAVYLAGAMLRARLRPPSSFDPTSGTLARIGGGSYEGPITLSAAMAASAILLRATGEWVNLGLLMEGEILFLAGYRFRQSYLRGLASTAFAGSVLKVILVDQPEGGTNWSPIAALSAAVFYINRMLRVSEGVVYSSVAAGLIVMLLAYKVPHEYLSVAWLGLAAILFETGFRLRQAEFRYQAYIAGALGTGAAIVLNVLGPFLWLPLALCAMLHYAATLRITLDARNEVLPEVEKKVSWFTASATAAYSFVIAWRIAPGSYLGVAWLLLGAVLFELGLRDLPKHFRWISYCVSGAGFVAMLFHPWEAIPLTIASVVCWSISARIFRSMPDRIGDQEREWCRDLYTAAGALFAMTLAWLKLPPALVALAWAVLGLALFEIGLRFALPRFRLLTHAITIAVCFRILILDFATLMTLPILASYYYIWWRTQRTTARIYVYVAAVLFLALARFELGWPRDVVAWALFGLALYAVGRLRDIEDLQWQSHGIALLSFFSTVAALAGNQAHGLAAAVVIASLYGAQLLASGYARAFYSLLASLLLAILLFYEVSGEALTIAWAAEALALLGAGFPLRDRVQRLSGLALFMICVLKLFLYDLRALETVNRILSFIVLGLILVGVSWMYTRFRDRIQRYL